MTDDLAGTYRRWRDAEVEGRNDDADAALMTVVKALGQPGLAPSSTFTPNVMAAVAAAAERDALAARRARTALIAASTVGGVLAIYFGGWLALSWLTSAFVWTLEVLVGAIVRTALAMRAGEGVWSVLTSLGRAAAAFASDPTVTFMVLMVQGVAIAALVVLHRLLGNDREWLK
jgi:hypothetical protein